MCSRSLRTLKAAASISLAYAYITAWSVWRSLLQDSRSVGTTGETHPGTGMTGHRDDHAFPGDWMDTARPRHVPAAPEAEADLMGAHSCKESGHIIIDHDIECLCCGKWTTDEDKIARHINRLQPHGELTDPRSIATDYGPADLHGEHFA